MNTISLKLFFIEFQRNEITDHLIYCRLSNLTKDYSLKELLEKIADDEMKHYSFWKEYTNKDVKPYYFKLFWYGYIMPFVSKKLALRFMKRLENYAHLEYTANLLNEVEGQWIINDESLHEKMLNQVLENDYLSKTVEE
ncbi:MAG TPA: hypothetical protein PK252_02355 [Bacteroidales bacterium]|nr:hypothetical protein [Bacteroidales bacterium]